MMRNEFSTRQFIRRRYKWRSAVDVIYEQKQYITLHKVQTERPALKNGRSFKWIRSLNLIRKFLNIPLSNKTFLNFEFDDLCQTYSNLCTHISHKYNIFVPASRCIPQTARLAEGTSKTSAKTLHFSLSANFFEELHVEWRNSTPGCYYAGYSVKLIFYIFCYV